MQPSYTLENLIKGLGKDFKFYYQKKSTYNYFPSPVDESKELANVLKKYQKDLQKLKTIEGELELLRKISKNQNIFMHEQEGIVMKEIKQIVDFYQIVGSLINPQTKIMYGKQENQTFWENLKEFVFLSKSKMEQNERQRKQKQQSFFQRQIKEGIQYLLNPSQSMKYKTYVPAVTQQILKPVKDFVEQLQKSFKNMPQLIGNHHHFSSFKFNTMLNEFQYRAEKDIRQIKQKLNKYLGNQEEFLNEISLSGIKTLTDRILQNEKTIDSDIYMIRLMSEHTFKNKFGKGIDRTTKVSQIVSQTVERIRKMYQIKPQTNTFKYLNEATEIYEMIAKYRKNHEPKNTQLTIVKNFLLLMESKIETQTRGRKSSKQRREQEEELQKLNQEISKLKGLVKEKERNQLSLQEQCQKLLKKISRNDNQLKKKEEQLQKNKKEMKKNHGLIDEYKGYFKEFAKFLQLQYQDDQIATHANKILVLLEECKKKKQITHEIQLLPEQELNFALKNIQNIVQQNISFIAPIYQEPLSMKIFQYLKRQPNTLMIIKTEKYKIVFFSTLSFCGTMNQSKMHGAILQPQFEKIYFLQVGQAPIKPDSKLLVMGNSEVEVNPERKKLVVNLRTLSYFRDKFGKVLKEYVKEKDEIPIQSIECYRVFFESNMPPKLMVEKRTETLPVLSPAYKLKEMEDKRRQSARKNKQKTEQQDPQKVEKMKKQIKELKQKLEIIRKRNQTLEFENKKIKGQFQQLKQENSSKIQKEKNGLQTDRKTEEKNRELEEKFQKLQSENQKILKQKQQLIAKMTKIEQSRNVKEKETKQFEQKNSQLNQQIQQLNKEKEYLENELKKANEIKDTKVEKITQCQQSQTTQSSQTIQERQRKIDELEKEIQQKEGQVKEMSENINKLKEKIKEISEENIKLKEEVQKSKPKEEIVVELDEKIKEKQKVLKNLATKQKDLERVKEQVKEKNNELTKIFNQTQEEIKKIQTIEEQKEEKQKKLDEININLENNEKKLNGIHQNIEESTKIIQQKTQKKEKLQTQISESEKSLSKIAKEKIEEGEKLKNIEKEYKEKKESLEKSIEEEKSRKQELQKELLKISENLTNAKDSLEQNEKKLSEIKEQYNSSSKNVSQMKQKEQKLFSQIQKQNNQLKELEEKTKQKRQEKLKIQYTINNSSQIMRKHEREIEQKQQRKKQIQKELQSKQIKLKEIQQKLNSIKDEQEKKRNQIRMMEEDLEDLQLGKTKVKKQIESVKNELQKKMRDLKKPANEIFIQDFLFTGDVLKNAVSEKSYLIENLQRVSERKIKKTQLLYSFPQFEEINFHKLIDHRQDFVIVVRLKNQMLLAGYSHQPLIKNDQRKGYGFISSLTNKETFELRKNYEQAKTVLYDDFFILFGNSQIKIKVHETKIESNLGIVYRFFDTGNHKNPKVLFGTEEKGSVLSSYQIFQVHFEN